MLAALGVLAILTLLSSVFLAHMRLEAAYAERDALQLKAHYLAVAGVETAISSLKNDSPAVDSFVDEWWQGDPPVAMQLGDGGFTAAVADESSRVNVLNASPQVLSGILGGDKEAITAILNFRSANRIFAVQDFKRADLSADAFSRVIMLGTVLGDGKVNINTANADVLAALPGMDSATAQKIVDFRNGPDGRSGTSDDFVFAVPADLAKVPGITRVRAAPAMPLVKVNSRIFRIETVGSVYKGSRVVSNKKVIAVVHRDENREVHVLSWEES